MFASAEASERDAATLDALVAKHKWRELPPEEAGEAATPAPGERWYFIAPLEDLVRSKNIKEPLTLDCMSHIPPNFTFKMAFSLAFKSKNYLL